MRNVAIISACILGYHCRYDGRILHYNLPDEIKRFRLVPVCPEQLAELPTPRERHKIIESRKAIAELGNRRIKIINVETKKDVTGIFISGAQKALEVALKHKVEVAFLKLRSPSCGVEFFDGERNIYYLEGVLTTLLRMKGIKIIPVV